MNLIHFFSATTLIMPMGDFGPAPVLAPNFCYTHSARDKYFDAYLDSQKRSDNLVKLCYHIQGLKNNWDGANAEKFDENLIFKVAHILKALPQQPDIFPTTRKSIQLEYEKPSGDYLEFEIFQDNITCLMVINDEETHPTITEDSQIKNHIQQFYA